MKTEENSLQLQIEVQKRIYVVRGVQVMVDRDLAELYGVDTSHLNRQVKRNADRFPLDFMFQLTREEFDSLRCQNVTANWSKVRYLPYVFTEEGVSTLSSVLKSSFAAETHVAVMRAFVAMRRFISANAGIFQRLDMVERHQIETDRKIDHVLDCLEEGTLKEKAHIPNKPLEIRKWRMPQHDRWLVIDDELWHCGASVKDAGSKTFGIDPICLDAEIVLKGCQ